MANFILERCSSDDQYIVGFDGRLNPQTGDTFSFSDKLTGETICGIVITGTNESTTYSAITEYNDCFDCVKETPRSANTEYEICEICCDCGTTSGSTINLLTPPHPVYTDGYGTPVTQLNMVTLGGPNGLNS
jgi:hypothetical protein